MGMELIYNVIQLMNGYINLLFKCLLITKVILLYFLRIINMQEVKYRILHDTIDMYRLVKK